MKKLGPVQLQMLRDLLYFGRWARNRSGWVWSNESSTLRIYQSLEKRGLVKVREDGFFHPELPAIILYYETIDPRPELLCDLNTYREKLKEDVR